MVSALAFSARSHGFDPRSRREKNCLQNMLSLVSFAVRRPSDRDVNWRSLVQGESPRVQVKEPYSSLHSLKPVCTKCTPAHYSREILRIGALTGGPPWPLCRESHHLCRLKDPTVVYMITCRLSFRKTGVYNIRRLIILERACSSMYRKKERLDKSYSKEPLPAF